MRFTYPLLLIETTIVSSGMRSSRSMSPNSSPLISVRRGSGYFFFKFAQFLANEIENVLAVGEDAVVFANPLHQFVMLVRELFLLQVHQLA